MDDPLLDRKIEYLVDMKINKLSSALESANETITMLTEQVNILQNKVQRLNVGVAPAEAQTRLGSEPKVSEMVETPSSVQATESPTESDNQSFSPEDVAVDKIFYYGNK